MAGGALDRLGFVTLWLTEFLEFAQVTWRNCEINSRGETR
jgi:hypothetical protein